MRVSTNGRTSKSSNHPFLICLKKKSIINYKRSILGYSHLCKETPIFQLMWPVNTIGYSFTHYTCTAYHSIPSPSRQSHVPVDVRNFLVTQSLAAKRGVATWWQECFAVAGWVVPLIQIGHPVETVKTVQTCSDLCWLVVSTPLTNFSQLGWLFPIYGKIKNVPNHQPVWYLSSSILSW
jgi:hypothetical protein